MFGIENRAELESEIAALASFSTNFDPSRASLPGDTPFERFKSLIDASADKTFRLAYPTTRDESAWTHSHLIYLSDLGVAAGYIDSQRGEALVKSSTQAIAGKFRNWDRFLQSFLMGATCHNGWEHERYHNIARLLSAYGPRWPES
jgi:hypothetical protein